VLCLQCAKVCPNENMGLGVANPDALVRRRSLLEPVEAAFVVLASGFVAHEVIGEVRWLDEFFHFVPERLSQWGPALAFDWWEGIWFLAIFPVVLWALVVAAGRLAGQREAFGRHVLIAATAVAPLVAMAHLAKSLAKLSGWGGYLPLALSDPAGVDTYRRIAAGELQAPGPVVALPVVGWLVLLLSVVVVFRSMRQGRLHPGGARAMGVALAVVSLVFLPVLLIWALS
jgi:hypothetical protein